MLLKTFKNVRSKVRIKLIESIKQKYDINDSGISSIISALNNFRDYVIVLFDHNKIMGAVSYYLSKKKYIEVNHIGVIIMRCGYGSILMREVFKVACLKNRHPVSLVTNGYSNEFYEKLEMVRINSNKLPAVYEMPKEKLEKFR